MVLGCCPIEGELSHRILISDVIASSGRRKQPHSASVTLPQYCSTERPKNRTDGDKLWASLAGWGSDKIGYFSCVSAVVNKSHDSPFVGFSRERN